MPQKEPFAALANMLNWVRFQAVPFAPPDLRPEEGWEPDGGWPATLGEAIERLRTFSGLGPHAYAEAVLAAGHLDAGLEHDIVMPGGTLPVGRDTFGNALLITLVELCKHDAHPFGATWFFSIETRCPFSPVPTSIYTDSSWPAAIL